MSQAPRDVGRCSAPVRMFCTIRASMDMRWQTGRHAREVSYQVDCNWVHKDCNWVQKHIGRGCTKNRQRKEPLWCSQEQFITNYCKSNYIGSAGALCVSTLYLSTRLNYISTNVCFSRKVFNWAMFVILAFLSGNSAHVLISPGPPCLV